MGIAAGRVTSPVQALKHPARHAKRQGPEPKRQHCSVELVFEHPRMVQKHMLRQATDIFPAHRRKWRLFGELVVR